MTIYAVPHIISKSQTEVAGKPFAGFFTCDNCAHPSIAMGGEATREMGQDKGAWDARRKTGFAEATNLEWLPGSAEGKEFADVPEHIASAADEAYRCRSFNALRACILLARGVIEATCKAKKITTGSLASKIDAMEAAEHIRSHTKDAAHEIRYMGNDMAHGDFVEAVDAEDADEMLALMSEFLNEVFQGPARVARAAAKRQARKTAS